MFSEARSSPRPSIILIDVNNKENNESLCMLTLLYSMVSPQLIKEINFRDVACIRPEQRVLQTVILIGCTKLRYCAQISSKTFQMLKKLNSSP